jgi:hypothetical protein
MASRNFSTSSNEVATKNESKKPSPIEEKITEHTVLEPTLTKRITNTLKAIGHHMDEITGERPIEDSDSGETVWIYTPIHKLN